MVTGVAPFTGDSPVAVAYKHVREAPVPPSRRNPDVPPDLEQIILTAMAKDPDLRYQSADDLRADLLRFRRGRPLAAAPVTALIADSTAAGATVANPRVPAAGATQQIGTLAPARTRGKRAVVTLVTVLVLALIVGAVVAVAQVAGENADKVEVPRVVGADFASASTRLTEAGFVVHRDLVKNDRVPKNRVISQDPEAGAMLKKGGTVTLKVSAGAGEIDVPPVAGQNADDARKLLEGVGLNVIVKGETNDTVPFGTVLRTEPGEGESIAVGSDITMIVSGGPAKVQVPNVLNFDITEASTQLNQAGLVLRQHTEASDTVDVGKVIRTDPGPNAEVPRGSPVDVFVSTGPNQATVPSVVGLSRADAEAAITGAELTPRVITSPSTKGNDGKVIAQDPGQGSKVERGTTVVITVGEFDNTTTTTSGSTTTTEP
jgi:eukaryotic-like serine/threonine-protein kinase